jgi:hypothetical protein
MTDYSRYAASFAAFMTKWQIDNYSSIRRVDLPDIFDSGGVKFELSWEVSEKLKVSGDIKNKIVWRRK